MDVELPELPFPLRTYGPDGHWSYEDGSLTGWAGPRQDRFVPPTGEALDPASDAPRLLGAPEGRLPAASPGSRSASPPPSTRACCTCTSASGRGPSCAWSTPRTCRPSARSSPAATPTTPTPSPWTAAPSGCGSAAPGRRLRLPRLPRRRAVDLRPAVHPGRREGVRGAALVGFMTQSPMGEGCVVTYDHIEFRPSWPQRPARRQLIPTSPAGAGTAGPSRVQV